MYLYKNSKEMQTNWILIGAVITIGIALIVYLILKNLKDKKKVNEYFNKEASHFPEEESEINDEK